MSMTQCKPVLDSPMVANHWAQPLSAPCRRGQIANGSRARSVRSISRVLSMTTTPLRPGQSCRSLQPSDVVDDGRAARLDAAMVAVDGFGGAHHRVRKALCSLLVGEEFDVLTQRSLVALQRQNGNRPSCRRSSGRCRSWHPGSASMVTSCPFDRQHVDEWQRWP